MMPGAVLNPGGRPRSAIEELRATSRLPEFFERLIVTGAKVVASV
jgi:hypothetical protein